MKDVLRNAFRNVDVEYGDVRVEETVRTSIVYHGQEPVAAASSSEVGGCLRVFRRGNWGVSSFNAPERDLRRLARETADPLELLPARHESIQGLPAADEELTVKPEHDVRRVVLEEKHRLLTHYNDVLLAQPGVTSTRAVYADRFTRCYFYSSENRFISQERVSAALDLTAIARDGTNVRSYSGSFGKPKGFSTLLGLESEVENIARTARELLTAEPVAAGVYTVVIDPLLAGLFAHEAFGHLAEADFTSRNERLRELTRFGARLGFDELAIVDDGTMPFEPGSSVYDDEGRRQARPTCSRTAGSAGSSIVARPLTGWKGI